MGGYTDGLPTILQGPAEEVAAALEDAKQAVADCGDTDLELAGPPEDVVTDGDVIDSSTGAPAGRRKVRYTARKTVRSKAKHASAGSGADLAARLQRAEQALRNMDNQWKQFLIQAKKAGRSQAYAKGAGTGNRAIYACTMANVAAAATGTSTAVVANADVEYDRVAFISNTPGLFTAFTAAGNPVIEGSASIVTDAGVILGPFELAEYVKLNGNGGVTASFTNRGAAAGDGQILFIPKGASFGSQPAYGQFGG